jgi:carbonic anhydrase
LFVSLFRNSKKYAGEIHFVHTDAAQTQYAVLGIFMQSSGPSTKTSKSHRGGRKKGVVNTDKATIDEWDKVFKIASQLHTTGSSAVASLELSTLMGTNLENFYRYSGSLTTPPCSETVTWTVFQKPIQFVNSQLESFRKIILENHRGPQLSYGRPVYRSFEDDEISEIPDNNVCVLPVDDESN